MSSGTIVLAVLLAVVKSNSAFLQPNGLASHQRNRLAFVHPKVTSTVLFEIDINAVTEAVKYPGEVQASAPLPTPAPVEVAAPPAAAPAPVEDAAPPAPAPVVASPAPPSKAAVELLPPPPPPAPETSLLDSIPFPVLGGPVLLAGLYVSYQMRMSKQARQAEEDAAEAAAQFSTTPPALMEEVAVAPVVEKPRTPEPEPEAAPATAETSTVEDAAEVVDSATPVETTSLDTSSGSDTSASFDSSSSFDTSSSSDGASSE